MKVRILVLSIFLSSTIQYASAAEAIARVAKVRGKVQIKRIAEPTFSGISAGQSIYTGDLINVGEPGFCMVVFLDDKSVLKIRESSRFQFVETENTRSLDVKFGKILSDIKRERKKDFRIETPVSVASVKGTQFWTVSNEMGFDKFYGLEGAVEIFNVISGQYVTLGPGQMTLSTATGQLVTSPVSPEEIPEDPEAGVEEKEIEKVPEEAAPAEEEVPEVGVPEEVEAPAEVPEEVAPPEEIPEAEEEEVPEEQPQPQPEAEGPLSMGLGFGSVTIDGVLYNQLALRPELTFGKLGIGLDVVLYLDPQGNIRKNEWDELTDVFDKILYVRWGEKGDPFFARYGSLENMTLGYGGLIYGYSNMMEFPQVRRIGLNTGVKFGSIGTEVFVANFKDFSRGGGLLGTRLTWNPWKGLILGGNLVMDVNQYAGLKDFDDDGVPDLLDDFPDNKKYSVDTDGDGIADNDPDELDIDGDGLTDILYPGMAEGIEDTIVLDTVIDVKPDPFNVKKVDARRAIGFAADVGYPVLRKKIVNLDVYAEGNFLTFADKKSGLGLVPLGLKLGLFRMVSVFFEYRMDFDHYIPRFFDQAYDLDRVAIVGSLNDQGNLVVQTKEQRIFGNGDPENRAGFYGGAGVDLLNLVSGSASYTDMRSATDTLRSFIATLNLNTDNIPKISQAFAYYQRNNDPNPFDFGNPSSNTIMGYRLGYEISKGVSLVWDYRRLYQDLDGDRKISDDPDAGEIINITTIETQFNF